MTTTNERFGFVAIIGRPNVGKSTLLNHLLAKKISITSRKPQTTRHRILGIKTKGATQIAYVDTPGLHRRSAAHCYLNRVAQAVLREVDVILFVVDLTRWTAEEDWILAQLKTSSLPVVLVINKIDRLADRKKLLPYLESVSKRFHFKTIVPISAKQGEQVGVLEQELIHYLPAGSPGFSPDQWTDHSDRFMASEILREKLFRLLGQELPYAVQITIDLFEEEASIIKIAAIIWVAKASQKAIVIGQKGDRLKKIATQARCDMEHYFEKKVFLKSWVKMGVPTQQEDY